MRKAQDFMSQMLPAPKNGGFRMEGYWIWCGSVVRGEDGQYHMFASRWPKSLPMHPDWLVASEVVRASAATPEGPYEFQEVVLPARGAEYWDGRSTHNPHITKHNGTYYLYYMGSTHPFPDVREGEPLTIQDPRYRAGHSRKRVGVATSTSVYGPWTRQEQPTLDTRPGTFDSYLTSNPAPCLHEDGSVLLVYKARKYETFDTHGPMTIGAAAAPHPYGPYTRVGEGPVFPPESMSIEDPFLWHDADGYHLIAKDMTGSLCGEKYGGVYARSQDGMHWEAAKGVQTYSRTVQWDDGTTSLLGNLDRPFILFHEGEPTHLFFAVSNGTNSFLDATDTWNMVIPLK